MGNLNWKHRGKWLRPSRPSRHLAGSEFIPGISLPRILGGLKSNTHSLDARLRNHCQSAHDGQVDPACNACKELQAKIKERKRGVEEQKKA